MRKLLVAAFLGLSGLAAVSANAMPIAPLSDTNPGVTLVAQGCGPGGWRGPYGGCRYGGPGPGFYAPGPRVYGFYGPRPYYAHPYYAHPYYGRHCWWRGGVRICN